MPFSSVINQAVMLAVHPVVVVLQATVIPARNQLCILLVLRWPWRLTAILGGVLGV